MQPLEIAVRAHVCRKSLEPIVGISAKAKPKPFKRKKARPSEWVLVFDTETKTDASQALRFGTYQIRKSGELVELGLFYDPETLRASEQVTLRRYAKAHGLKVVTLSEFVDQIFFGIGYEFRGSIVGFNLPFDISRLAIAHAPARTTQANKTMQGGFSFQLSEEQRFPRVQIKHVSARQSFIQFAATKGQRTYKNDRKKNRWQPVRRGYFVDIKTLAAALTSTSHSLESLGKALHITAQKLQTASHGKALTAEYLAYALQDTEATWQCYTRLVSLYELHGLNQTAPHSILSEASLGKAYLREMGVKAWQVMQPDFPPEITGYIMSAYYGGRSEVHYRRIPVQILYCDFLSMYPTVCTLMGLWRFVTAKGMTWREATTETQAFLNDISADKLQRPETWLSLCSIVQLAPDNDIFPVRAKYSEEAQFTIGLNYLTSEAPLWFTLADCISSKLLTGKAPVILQSLVFEPQLMQDALMPVNISGQAEYRVNPASGDFFKQIIDLRTSIRAKMKIAATAEYEALNSQQQALKILANSTSYGIFVELNVETGKTKELMNCYGVGKEATTIAKNKYEAPGALFHPLLATLITGAARLLLALSERMVHDAGLDWAFCDTDSIAIAKPNAMAQEAFYAKAKGVQEWFTALNPYEKKAPLLKIEDYNYRVSGDGFLEPLYCFAISSKRYALYNLDRDGKIVLRKVSAHGLGHLKAPYKSAKADNLDGVEVWQQEFWAKIIESALAGNCNSPNYGALTNFNLPAISRYGATTPQLEKWFSKYNADKAYKESVRPFNFLISMQAKANFKHLKAVAPFSIKAPVTDCFDRITGLPIKKAYLKTNLEVLAQYHLHPEAKFLNGDYLDRGLTQRRHIVATAIHHIGKEANKWEEQFFLGMEPTAQIEYGIANDKKDEMLKAIYNGIAVYGIKAIASGAKVSGRYIRLINSKKSFPSEMVLGRIYGAIRKLETDTIRDEIPISRVISVMAEKGLTARSVANALNVDPSNFAKVLSGQRKSKKVLISAAAYLNL